MLADSRVLNFCDESWTVEELLELDESSSCDTTGDMEDEQCDDTHGTLDTQTGSSIANAMFTVMNHVHRSQRPSSESFYRQVRCIQFYVCCHAACTVLPMSVETLSLLL